MTQTRPSLWKIICNFAIQAFVFFALQSHSALTIDHIEALLVGSVGVVGLQTWDSSHVHSVKELAGVRCHQCVAPIGAQSHKRNCVIVIFLCLFFFFFFFLLLLSFIIYSSFINDFIHYYVFILLHDLHKLMMLCYLWFVQNLVVCDLESRPVCCFVVQIGLIVNYVVSHHNVKKSFVCSSSWTQTIIVLAGFWPIIT